MAITKQVSEHNNKLTIHVEDKFDFSLYQNFREAYSDFEPKGGQFILDLSKTTYMDSSALGMILLLKEHAEKFAAHVVISKPNDVVYKILEIAQFQKLMTIEH